MRIVGDLFSFKQLISVFNKYLPPSALLCTQINFFLHKVWTDAMKPYSVRFIDNIYGLSKEERYSDIMILLFW